MPVCCDLTPLQRAASLPTMQRFHLSDPSSNSTTRSHTPSWLDAQLAVQRAKEKLLEKVLSERRQIKAGFCSSCLFQSLSGKRKLCSSLSLMSWMLCTDFPRLQRCRKENQAAKCPTWEIWKISGGHKSWLFHILKEKQGHEAVWGCVFVRFCSLFSHSNLWLELG